MYPRVNTNSLTQPWVGGNRAGARCHDLKKFKGWPVKHERNPLQHLGEAGWYFLDMPAKERKHWLAKLIKSKIPMKMNRDRILYVYIPILSILIIWGCEKEDIPNPRACFTVDVTEANVGEPVTFTIDAQNNGGTSASCHCPRRNIRRDYHTYRSSGHRCYWCLNTVNNL